MNKKILPENKNLYLYRLEQAYNTELNLYNFRCVFTKNFVHCDQYNKYICFSLPTLHPSVEELKELLKKLLNFLDEI